MINSSFPPVVLPVNPVNFDFHCHSTVSDGLLSPAAVAARAAANGVDCWALTDHDALGGLPEAEATATELGMRFVNGVEISIEWRGTPIHIVGLAFDRTVPAWSTTVGGGRGAGSHWNSGSWSKAPDVDMATRVAARAAASSQSAGGFHVGQNVRHAKFGAGVILAAEGRGDEARVQVRFGAGQAGTKWLALAYAKLEAA